MTTSVKGNLILAFKIILTNNKRNIEKGKRNTKLLYTWSKTSLIVSHHTVFVNLGCNYWQQSRGKGGTYSFPSQYMLLFINKFLYLQEVYCNDEFVLHGWQPRPAHNTSTPNSRMRHHYSPCSF
jgi:hypothetical protein